MHVVRHRIMRSIMLSEWVTYDVSTMYSAWHIRVDGFVVIMDSLSHQRKKCKLYKNRIRFGYDLNRSEESSFGFYELLLDCISLYFIDFMELKSKLCAWIHCLL